MEKSIFAVLIVSIWLQASGSIAQSNSTDKIVEDFVSMLVSKDPVFLSDYEKFYGESSEQELEFELRECEARGWSSHSKACVSFTRDRRTASQTVNSYLLDFVRDHFSTPGKSFKIGNPIPSSEGYAFLLVDVWIGNHKFVLFQPTTAYAPGGSVVVISTIDGKSVKSHVLGDEAPSKISPNGSR